METVVAEAQWHWSPAVFAILAYVAIGPSLIAYYCWEIGRAHV